jgi:ubiquinone/menaquinone biosynthesis C-methylase UbiE
MTWKNLLRKLPVPLRTLLIRFLQLIVRKQNAEMSYWRKRFMDEGGVFMNSHYERIMLAMAGETTSDFVKGKIVADFGCGPRGSLNWADGALIRIGIDLLADKYADEFTKHIILQNMIWVKSTEKVIPLPSDSVDILFTMNALDHVQYFDQICNELIRVLKRGGLFVGSINIDEPPTLTEPQQLTEAIVWKHLLNKLQVERYIVADKVSDNERYVELFKQSPTRTPGKPGVIWVRARKPS